MKRLNVLLSIGVIVLFVFGGAFFVFGDDVLTKDFYGKVFSGEWPVSEGDSGGGITFGDETSDEAGGGSEGGDSGSSDYVNDAGQICSMKQISYSLRNFGESVVCQEQGESECVSLVVNCSVGLYNLDDDFSGDFEIRYALMDSLGNELDAKTLSKNVVAGGNEKLSLGFVKNGAGGVDEGSSCLFGMISVPMKEVCN